MKFSFSSFVRALISVLLLAHSLTVFAEGRPWRAATQVDLDGLWRQVGVVILGPKSEVADPWYQSKQFFRFLPDGGYKHVLVNPDSDPNNVEPNKMQRFMLMDAPVTQTIRWHSQGIAILKHPERPPQRIDIGLYVTDAKKGPNDSALQPRKGDLILVFYNYKDANKAEYYRLLRQLP